MRELLNDAAAKKEHPFQLLLQRKQGKKGANYTIKRFNRNMNHRRTIEDGNENENDEANKLW